MIVRNMRKQPVLTKKPSIKSPGAKAISEYKKRIGLRGKPRV